ncbi:MAG: class I SAM-dependent methyltransferase [Candidatus Aenigmarchaeota archaeon]|nr:class I SAM-dependent methyltransferase [Candidatus Aenigmarchaeota archaeon]
MEAMISSTEKYYSGQKSPEMIDEVSLSHLLREKNPFTKDSLPFGGQLARIMKERKLIPPKPSILEIGPGLGDVAKSFTSELCGEWNYTFFDLSKRIIGFLKGVFPKEKFRFIAGDVLKIGERKERYNFIICNEVLADLPMVINPFSDVGETDHEKWEMVMDARRQIDQYGIKLPKRDVVFNYGAIRFLEQVSRILEKKGIVFISENACDPGYPRMIPVYGHNEFSIKFDWLEKAAKKLGFSVETGKITDLLEIRNRDFLSMFLLPELKVIFDHLNFHNIEKHITGEGSKALSVDEFLRFLDEYSDKINIDNLDHYKKMLKKSARNITLVTGQFRYLILRKK